MIIRDRAESDEKGGEHLLIAAFDDVTQYGLAQSVKLNRLSPIAYHSFHN